MVFSYVINHQNSGTSYDRHNLLRCNLIDKFLLYYFYQWGIDFFMIYITHHCTGNI